MHPEVFPNNADTKVTFFLIFSNGLIGSQNSVTAQEKKIMSKYWSCDSAVTSQYGLMLRALISN